MESSRNREMQIVEGGGPASWNFVAVARLRPAVLQAAIHLADRRCLSDASVAAARGERGREMGS